MLTIWGEITEDCFLLDYLLVGWEQANFDRFTKMEWPDYVI